MHLPENARRCMALLEQSGFCAYAVGGCVRDALLGLTPHDYDLCTDATPEQMHQVFHGFSLVTSGEKHGTVGVIIDRESVEITTFRVENGYADCRHPDSVRFVRSLAQDLSRRDFTVNAMAYHPETGYQDPFGGQQDLADRVLRTVGDPEKRFREDALRILRGVRFAVKYRLTPEKNTLSVMFTLAPLLDQLAKERIFDELCKLLPLVTAEDLLTYAPILTQVLPELAPSVGFCQHSPHHAFDVFTHTANVVASVPPTLPMRWAALLHDAGKPACFTMDENGIGHFYGHADVSADLAEQVLSRLKAPNALREQTVFLIRHHMLLLEPDKKLLRRRLGKYGVDATLSLNTLQQADFCSKGNLHGRPEDFQRIACMIQEILAEDACLSLKDLAVNGADLLAIGFQPGKTLGACLNHLLEQVQEENLPNTRDALLKYAEKIRRDQL